MTDQKKGNTMVMLIVIFLGYACIYIDKNVIGLSVVSIAQDLNLDASQKGMILSAFFLGYTILQIPFAYLSNRIGTRKILIMSITLVSVFMVAMGFGFSLMYILIIRFFTGAFAHAGYPANVSSFISQELPDNKRGPAQAAMIASSGFAAIVGPLAVAPLLQVIGWKRTYFVLGAVVLIIAIAMGFLIPKEYGGVKPEIVSGRAIKIIDILKDANVLIMIVSAFFMNAAIYGLNGWLASYIIDLFKLSLTGMAAISAIIGFFTMIAAMAGGIVVNKFFRGKEKQVILITSLICSGLILTISRITTLVPSMVLLVIVAGSSSIAFSTFMSLPVKFFKQSEVGAKYATINALGVFGGFVAPIVIGNLVKQASGSYTTTFIFLGVLYILSGLIAMLVKNRSGNVRA